MQKLPIKNIEQLDEMIKKYANPIKNNFCYLFTQLVSQLAKMDKKKNANNKMGMAFSKITTWFNIRRKQPKNVKKFGKRKLQQKIK